MTLEGYAASVAEPTPAPAATPTAKKAPKKAKAAKKAAPKVAKKATAKAKKAAPKSKAAKPTGDRPISGTQLAVLKLLAKGRSMSRPELSAKLDGAWVGSDMMGHFDSSQAKPTSLTARGLVRYDSPDEEGGPATYAITAAGRKYLEKAGK